MCERKLYIGRSLNGFQSKHSPINPIIVMKLNILLAITDEEQKVYKNLVTDYIKFFKGSQGAFRGEKKTYTPKEGTVDEPTKRNLVVVQTTMNEKLEWYQETAAKYINALFSQEKTNASGLCKAELVVDGVVWGEFSSLELLRLKSLVDNGNVLELYANIPVRSDGEIWNPTHEEIYEGRDVFQTPVVSSVVKTTTKESYILADPNIALLKDASAYKPAIATKDTIVELGDSTSQKFSGEWSQRQRAEVLKRRQTLITAVTEALKKANEAEAVSSELTAKKIFGYLHTGVVS
jgi:hypothetical protein